MRRSMRFVHGWFRNRNMNFSTSFLKRSIVWSLFLCASITTNAQHFDWAQSIGGLGLDVGRAITTDDDGNVIVVGNFTGGTHIGGTYLTGYGSMEAFVAKFTSEGSLLWANVISGPAEDMARGVETDHLGNVYVVGHFTDTVIFHLSEFDTIAAKSEGMQDVFVVKYDANGALQWKLTGGGTENDTGTDIARFPWSGKLYVCGGFEKRAKFGTATILSNGLADAFLMKIDPDGNAHWIVKGGGLEHDIAAAVAVNQTTEEIYIAGDFYDEALFEGVTLEALGSSDMFLAKFDEDGNMEWAATNGGTSVDVATGVETDLNGKVYVSGYYQGTTYFQNFSTSALSYNDVFLSQFNPDGTCQWLQSAGSWGLDNCLGLAVDWDGSAYLTGMFEELMITPTDSTAGDGYDIYVLAYNPDGSVKYVRNAGAASSDFGMATCIGPDKALYLTGYYFYFADFDNTTIGPADYGDCFVARMSDILGVNETNTNPFNNHCLRFNNLTNTVISTCQNKCGWKLTNTLGQTLAEGNLSERNKLPELGTGIYHFSISGKDGQQTIPVLIR